MRIHEYYQNIEWLNFNMVPPSQKTNSDNTFLNKNWERTSVPFARIPLYLTTKSSEQYLAPETDICLASQQMPPNKPRTFIIVCTSSSYR